MHYSKQTNGFYTSEIHGINIPPDAVEISDAEYAALIEGQSQGKIIVADASGHPVLQNLPPLTFDQQKDANIAAIQAELDRQANLKGYDDIVSACSYAAQASGAPFQAEGAAFLTWRSDSWTQAYSVLAEVQAGTRAMPTPDEAVAMMPALVLP